jgi:phage-related protein
MRNYFVFDYNDSRDFGVYISGQGTFNAPGREYENIAVPGRDGDLLVISVMQIQVSSEKVTVFSVIADGGTHRPSWKIEIAFSLCNAYNIPIKRK